MDDVYGAKALLTLPASDPGGYQIIFELPECTIRVGRLGPCRFAAGVYIYSGSALRGIRQRVLRHLRTEKREHWHIDYVLPHGRILGVRYVISHERLECSLHRAVIDVLGGNEPVPGFGASDCRCSAHLAMLRRRLSPATIDRRLRGRTTSAGE